MASNRNTTLLQAITHGLAKSKGPVVGTINVNGPVFWAMDDDGLFYCGPHHFPRVAEDAYTLQAKDVYAALTADVKGGIDKLLEKRQPANTGWSLPDIGPRVRSLSLPAGAIQVVRKAMAVSDIRYYLNGVLIDLAETQGGSVIATDGHRLMAVRDAALPGYNARVIVPEAMVPYLGLLEREAEDGRAQISIVDGDPGVLRFILADCRDGVVMAKEVDGKYPDYSRVVPAYTGEPALMTAGTAAQAAKLIGDALQTARKAALAKRGEVIEATISNGVVALRDKSGERRSDDLQAFRRHTPPGMAAITVNAVYLVDALAALGEAEVGVWLAPIEPQTRPLLFCEVPKVGGDKPPVEQRLAVVMPMNPSRQRKADKPDASKPAAKPARQRRAASASAAAAAA